MVQDYRNEQAAPRAAMMAFHVAGSTARSPAIARPGPISTAHRVDEARLDRWMAAHVPGHGGDLAVSPLAGGASNPISHGVHARGLAGTTPITQAAGVVSENGAAHLAEMAMALLHRPA